MLWLEDKYILLLSYKLPLFKRVKQQLYSFRCPICGDSRKNQSKRRGGLFVPPNSSSFMMHCFNCGASMKFTNFLKLQDALLFNEYLIEYYQTKNEESLSVTPNTSIVHQINSSDSNKKLNLSNLSAISQLPESHPAVKYVMKRKIPEKHWNKLYFILRYKQWECEFNKKQMTAFDKQNEHSRLVIPFFDKKGNITRISARAFDPRHEPKYIYMKVTDDASRVYGLDTVDAEKLVYVFEGPIDSLFIENSVATGSASLLVPELSCYNTYVLVPDNQPRNPEVCKQIKSMIDSGSNVCLWNQDWGKDINEMVLNNKHVKDIKNLIDDSTVSGAIAQIKFQQWIKCKLR